jgi:hypothetical protein
VRDCGADTPPTLHTSFTDALVRTRKALGEHGFGVLIKIDVRATSKAKLGAEMGNSLS